MSTDWVAEHLNDPKVKLIEVDVETTSYDKATSRTRSAGTGRPICTIASSATHRSARVRGALPPRGNHADDTVIFYGDNNNWFAAWALWQFKYHGHKDARLMNGGRKKWELEKRR